VLDALFTDPGIIGSTITLTDGNDSDTLSMFAGRSFKVVGLVNSPLYINFTRGTTTLGSGSVQGLRIHARRDLHRGLLHRGLHKARQHRRSIHRPEYKRPWTPSAPRWRQPRRSGPSSATSRWWPTPTASTAALWTSITASAASFDVQKAAAYKKLADAKAQLDAAEASLPEKRAELDSGWNQYYAAQAAGLRLGGI
jgi:putative ABC transport system permease protein